MPTMASSSTKVSPPWLHLRPLAPLPPARVDINRADAELLRAELGLARTAVNKILKIRQQRPVRDLDDLVQVAGLSADDRKKIRQRVVGSVRNEVVLLDAGIEGKTIYSDRPFAIRARFLPPNGGRAVLASLRVRWRGQPFTVQQKIGDDEHERGEVLMSLGRDHYLPPGPVELFMTLYDSLGGASSRGMREWVFPSNPLSLFVSPGNRSIFNGSVRPDWQPQNWVTSVNVTLLNGDNSAVSMARPVTWKFWDGGVGGTLVESGTFDWPSSITVPALGSFAGGITFTSPPGSGIHNRYEDMEDMSIEIIFQKAAGGSVSGTVTCRIMAGWGINIIEVGSYNGSEESTIAAGIADARDVYENHGLTFSSEQWWIISDSDAGGYTVLNDEDEWGDLLDDWTVQNDSVDCFVVRGMWDSFGGFSPIGGPDDKDDKEDGLAVTFSLGCLAHELGHYMGDLEHADNLGSGNVMFSTCGGRNFTYDQYKEFFDHEWTRIVR